MTTSTLVSTTVPSVRFGATHGYRFDGDTVELNATFHVTQRSAHDRSWALQLWACPSVPARSDDLVGHLVAEAPLPPIAEIAGEAEAFTVTAAAQPPAGDRDHSMVLVLAARRGGGDFDEVHDVTSFPARERFLLPRLAGPVTYRVGGDRVRVEVAAIENPRDVSNASGTLSLELWALPAPYSGANFRGAPLAGAVLGTLAGQARWEKLELELAYTPPPSGATHVVVMLREWTGAGYTTRDFASLGVIGAAAPIAPAPAAPAVTPPAVAATPAPAPAAKPAAPAPALQAVPTPKPPEKSAAPVVATTKTSAGRTSGKISVNTATLDELAAVKGLPRAVAERIVRDRPFTSIDDIVKVKGMGEKLLAKIRSQLAL